MKWTVCGSVFPDSCQPAVFSYAPVDFKVCKSCKCEDGCHVIIGILSLPCNYHSANDNVLDMYVIMYIYIYITVYDLCLYSMKELHTFLTYDILHDYCIIISTFLLIPCMDGYVKIKLNVK